MPDLRNQKMRQLWSEDALNIIGAQQNNLANIDQAIPLRQLVLCVRCQWQW